MDEELKQKAIKLVKKFFRKQLIILTAISVILVSIVSIIYVVTLNDGSYQKGDKTNVPYVIDEYTGNIALSGDGGNALIKGLSLVDLKTTGDISLIKTNTVNYISLINGNKR